MTALAGDTFDREASVEHELVCRLEQAGFERVAIVLDATGDAAMLGISARSPSVSVRVYNFDPHAPGAAPTRVLDIDAQRAIVMPRTQDAGISKRRRRR